MLARRRPGTGLAPAVAPGTDWLGIMLPYTPLHHLLLQEVGAPLVMTSGNLSDEPIAHRDDDARARLGGIADAFLRPRPTDPHARGRFGGPGRRRGAGARATVPRVRAAPRPAAASPPPRTCWPSAPS